MNELLTAFVAAAKVGFDAPRCRPCTERPVTRFTLSGEPLPDLMYCPACHATGLDASDPERLIGRAMEWLWSRGRNVTDDEYPTISAAVRDAETGCGMRGLKLCGYYKFQCHDGTPTGLATALLRLVARVGGAA